MVSATPQHFAVVIPAYNEAMTIRDIASRACIYTDLVVIVNDGSTDNTVNSLDGLPVTILSNPSNIGKGESLIRGARHAIEKGADFVITLDGDGQHRPDDIPLLLEAATHYPGMIIIAARLRGRSEAPPLRRFANKFADFWISWAAGHHIRDTQSGFRLYPSMAFKQCTGNATGFTFESEILINASRCGIFTHSVAIDTIYDKQARPSHYKPASDTLSIVRMVAWKLLCRGLYPTGLLRSLGLMKHI
jgi:glycosyltransferase involved in cell wall biosynthesis